MIEIDKKFLSDMLAKAAENPRLRQNYDLRTSTDDNSQRMLNALLPGTEVPIHRHPHSTENVLLLQGKLVEILYEEERLGDGFEPGMDAQDVLRDRRFWEIDRVVLDAAGRFGCVVPAGVWHTVEVLEPSVIYEAKDGKYGADGSEQVDLTRKEDSKEVDETQAISGEEQFENGLGDLKKNIEYLIDMERHSSSMEVITPLYVSRMLNEPLDKVEKAMKEMEM